jgi:phospholipase A1/A2
MRSVFTAFALATFGTATTAAPPLPPPLYSVVSVHVEAGVTIVARIAMMSVNNIVMPTANRVTTMLHVNGGDIPLNLARTGPPVTVPANGYVVVEYRAARPAGLHSDRAILSLDNPPDGYAFALGDGQGGAATRVARASAPPPASTELLPAPPGGVAPPPRPGNPYLANLTAYNPIYGLIGSGTDTNAKLELSFKYQLFGTAGEPRGSWLNGFHFAYTQRMFWDTAADSAPFHDVNYQPEFLYIYMSPANEHGVVLGGRGGFLHESNGRDGTASRGYSILYAQPDVSFPLGGWTFSIGPRIFKYIIGRDRNADIAQYRGHQALALSIGQENGLKLSTFSRLNFGTGKGSVDADLSYPLTHLWKRLPLYLVVQGFKGYGEDLLDYDRRQTRLRIGVGIVR